ncbi:hypothetical protein [Cupriavidus basilensis]|uniref:Uncharacterized protein n=1 Tax=marine sediment metagenome TaxID=412755 RepID=X1M3K8_9ZZZZ|nr:hypothetical protein [Cupriavidus basilensis]MCP3023790.1 hypothetical protein [Cupriavidus basilensis]
MDVIQNNLGKIESVPDGFANLPMAQYLFSLIRAANRSVIDALISGALGDVQIAAAVFGVPPETLLALAKATPEQLVGLRKIGLPLWSYAYVDENRTQRLLEGDFGSPEISQQLLSTIGSASAAGGGKK